MWPIYMFGYTNSAVEHIFAIKLPHLFMAYDSIVHSSSQSIYMVIIVSGGFII